jgi:hypothetical protein
MGRCAQGAHKIHTDVLSSPVASAHLRDLCYAVKLAVRAASNGLAGAIFSLPAAFLPASGHKDPASIAGVHAAQH